MKYRIKFSTGRWTTTRFHDWNNAKWFLMKVLKYKLENNEFIKHNVTAEIVCINGIPF